MTTGTRLTNGLPVWLTVLKLLTSATVWCLIGSFLGWNIGQAGGFRRGIVLMSNTVIQLAEKLKQDDERDASSLRPPKYTDL